MQLNKLLKVIEMLSETNNTVRIMERKKRKRKETMKKS